MKKQVHHTYKVRRSSWRIVCAGGYFASGFSGTIGHGDAWNRIDAPNKYLFVLKDEGAGAQLSILYKFFTSLHYWKMEPYAQVEGDALALADGGSNYVVYLPHGGSAKLTRKDTGKLYERWLNSRTGKMGRTIRLPEKEKLSFTAPDTRDWVLWIRKKAW